MGSMGIAPRGGDAELDWAADLDIQLTNLLRNIERLSFVWHANGKERQYFQLQFEWPVLWASPWGIGAKIRTRREPGAHRLYSLGGSILYSISPSHHFRLSGEYENAQQPAREGPEQSTHVETTRIRFGYLTDLQSHQWDWPEGFRFESSFSVGRRRQDTLAVGATLSGRLGSQYDFCYHRFWILRLAISTEGVFSLSPQSPLLPVEYFRIGGNNGFLGFQDFSIHAPWYGIAQLEPGVQVENWLRLALLSSMGTASVETPPYPLLLGVGIGAEFNTDIGRFRLALGKGWDSSTLDSPKPLMLHLRLRFTF